MTMIAVENTALAQIAQGLGEDRIKQIQYLPWVCLSGIKQLRTKAHKDKK